MKNWQIITIVSVLTVGIGGLGYWYFTKPKASNDSTASSKKFTAKYKGKDIKPIDVVDDRDSTGKSKFSDDLGLYGGVSVFGIVLNNKFFITGKVQGGSNVAFINNIEVSQNDLYELKFS